MTSSSLVYNRVTAPRFILSRTMEDVPCNVENTWSEFLKHICKLDVEPNADLLIRTGTPLGSGGWLAKLEDKVHDFVKKYTYARKNYTIYLVSDTVRNLVPPPNLHGFVPLSLSKKNDFIFTTNGMTTGVVTRQKQRTSDAFAAALKTKKSSGIYISKASSISKQLSKPRPQSLQLVPVPSSSEKRKQMAVTPFSISGQLPVMELVRKDPVVASDKENGNDATQNKHVNPIKRAKTSSEDDYRVNPRNNDVTKRTGSLPMRWFTNDDNVSTQIQQHFLAIFSHRHSCYTSVSMVQRDLDRDGIDNAEIKRKVVERLVRNFDNAAMLRIQHELKGLVRNGSWHRLTTRVPRTGHLLQDIFQIFAANTD